MNTSRLPRRLAASAGEQLGRLVSRVREPLTELAVALRGEGTLLHGDRLPLEGPVIVVANHRHVLDARVLVAHLPRAAVVVDASELDEAVQRRRAHEEGRRDGWRRAMKAIMDGDLLVLLPEGAPSPDPAVHRGRTGVGWLLAAAQRLGAVPVLPVSLDARAAVVEIGRPLDLSRWGGVEVNRSIARAVCDEVMTALAETVGAGYSDSYVTTARAQARGRRLRRQDARRLDLLASRDARLRAEQHRREQAESERQEMARLQEMAAEKARRHAEEAAARDRARLGGV